MNKYWYFVAQVMCINNIILYYKGYVAAKGLFPIYYAEEQTKKKVKIPEEYEREGLFLEVLIVNQAEVEESDYDDWKQKNQIETSAEK